MCLTPPIFHTRNTTHRIAIYVVLVVHTEYVCVCVHLLQFAGQVLNLPRAGALEPDTVVSDVEVVHDIVWLRGIENPSHVQQTLQQLPATFVCTCE